MEGTLAEIRGFAGNFAPRNWAYCQGQLLPINQNQALFSLLGTTYGGDGRTTFGLPDLRGRSPIGSGHGPGLSSRNRGQKLGTNYNTLTANNLPAHTHSATVINAQVLVSIPALADEAGTGDPTNHILASGLDSVGNEVKNFSADPADTALAAFAAPFNGSVTVMSTGAGQQQSNTQPFLGLNYVICVSGTFPSRS